jgi:hypothetical protein
VQCTQNTSVANRHLNVKCLGIMFIMQRGCSRHVAPLRVLLGFVYVSCTWVRLLKSCYAVRISTHKLSEHILQWGAHVCSGEKLPACMCIGNDHPASQWHALQCRINCGGARTLLQCRESPGVL